ncbi:MAG: hypothetical protein AB8F74_12050 [Saprospiraceae bacterium]
MLDKIMDMVGGEAISAMTEKAGISTDQAKQMLPFAQESLQEGMMSQVTSGNLDGVLGMFKNFAGGNASNDGLFGNIQNMFAKKVMTNMGIPESIAGLAANSGLVSIVGNLTSKIKGAGDTDDIDASSLLSVLGQGDGAAGLMGKAAGLLGGLTGGGDDKSADQGNDMGDKLKDAAKDMLGGFFK